MIRRLPVQEEERKGGILKRWLGDGGGSGEGKMMREGRMREGGRMIEWGKGGRGGGEKEIGVRGDVR